MREHIGLFKSVLISFGKRQKKDQFLELRSQESDEYSDMISQYSTSELRILYTNTSRLFIEKCAKNPKESFPLIQELMADIFQKPDYSILPHSAGTYDMFGEVTSDLPEFFLLRSVRMILEEIEKKGKMQLLAECTTFNLKSFIEIIFSRLQHDRDDSVKYEARETIGVLSRHDGIRPLIVDLLLQKFKEVKGEKKEREVVMYVRIIPRLYFSFRTIEEGGVSMRFLNGLKVLMQKTNRGVLKQEICTIISALFSRFLSTTAVMADPTTRQQLLSLDESKSKDFWEFYLEIYSIIEKWSTNKKHTVFCYSTMELMCRLGNRTFINQKAKGGIVIPTYFVMNLATLITKKSGKQDQDKRNREELFNILSRYFIEYPEEQQTTQVAFSSQIETVVKTIIMRRNDFSPPIAETEHQMMRRLLVSAASKNFQSTIGEMRTVVNAPPKEVHPRLRCIVLAALSALASCSQKKPNGEPIDKTKELQEHVSTLYKPLFQYLSLGQAAEHQPPGPAKEISLMLCKNTISCFPTLGTSNQLERKKLLLVIGNLSKSDDREIANSAAKSLVEFLRQFPEINFTPVLVVIYHLLLRELRDLREGSTSLNRVFNNFTIVLDTYRRAVAATDDSSSIDDSDTDEEKVTRDRDLPKSASSSSLRKGKHAHPSSSAIDDGSSTIINRSAVNVPEVAFRNIRMRLEAILCIYLCHADPHVRTSAARLLRQLCCREIKAIEAKTDKTGRVVSPPFLFDFCIPAHIYRLIRKCGLDELFEDIKEPFKILIDSLRDESDSIEEMVKRGVPGWGGKLPASGEWKIDLSPNEESILIEGSFAPFLSCCLYCVGKLGVLLMKLIHSFDPDRRDPLNAKFNRFSNIIETCLYPQLSLVYKILSPRVVGLVHALQVQDPGQYTSCSEILTHPNPSVLPFTSQREADIFFRITKLCSRCCFIDGDITHGKDLVKDLVCGFEGKKSVSIKSIRGKRHIITPPKDHSSKTPKSPLTIEHPVIHESTSDDATRDISSARASGRDIIPKEVEGSRDDEHEALSGGDEDLPKDSDEDKVIVSPVKKPDDVIIEEGDDEKEEKEEEKKGDEEKGDEEEEEEEEEEEDALAPSPGSSSKSPQNTAMIDFEEEDKPLAPKTDLEVAIPFIKTLISLSYHSHAGVRVIINTCLRSVSPSMLILVIALCVQYAFEREVYGVDTCNNIIIGAFSNATALSRNDQRVMNKVLKQGGFPSVSQQQPIKNAVFTSPFFLEQLVTFGRVDDLLIVIGDVLQRVRVRVLSRWYADTLVSTVTSPFSLSPSSHPSSHIPLLTSLCTLTEHSVMNIDKRRQRKLEEIEIINENRALRRMEKEKEGEGIVGREEEESSDIDEPIFADMGSLGISSSKKPVKDKDVAGEGADDDDSDGELEDIEYDFEFDDVCPSESDVFTQCMLVKPVRVFNMITKLNHTLESILKQSVKQLVSTDNTIHKVPHVSPAQVYSAADFDFASLSCIESLILACPALFDDISIILASIQSPLSRGTYAQPAVTHVLAAWLMSRAKSQRADAVGKLMALSFPAARLLSNANPDEIDFIDKELKLEDEKRRREAEDRVAASERAVGSGKMRHLTTEPSAPLTPTSLGHSPFRFPGNPTFIPLSARLVPLLLSPMRAPPVLMPNETSAFSNPLLSSSLSAMEASSSTPQSMSGKALSLLAPMGEGGIDLGSILGCIGYTEAI
ncbi:hypothetical protein ADUPG1_007975, partial [Aduncisulcus paluster]